MNKRLAAVFGVVPTAAIAWATKWTALFENTYFFPYDEPEKVASSGIAVGIVVAVVFAIVFRKLSARAFGWLSLAMLFATIVLACACWGIRVRLDYPSTRELAQVLIKVWQGVAILLIASVLQAILFATMAGLAATFSAKDKTQDS
jgi:hypothetical protein